MAEKAVLQAKSEAEERDRNRLEEISHLKCEGCGNSLTLEESSICPLCQAMGRTDIMFCSQSCFAKNWLQHRDSIHPSGKVTQQAQPKSEGKRGRSGKEAADDGIGKKRKRESAKAEIEDEEHIETKEAKCLVTDLWPCITVDSLTQKGWKAPSASIPSNWVRLNFAASMSKERKKQQVSMNGPAVWGMYATIVDLYQQHHRQENIPNSTAKSEGTFFVLCGSAKSAAAMAWFFHCNVINDDFNLMLSMNWWYKVLFPKKKTNSAEEGHPNLVIASVESLAYFIKKKKQMHKDADALPPLDHFVSAHLRKDEKGTLVVLPDVSNAAEYQPLTARAAFFHWENTEQEEGTLEVPLVPKQALTSEAFLQTSLFSSSDEEKQNEEAEEGTAQQIEEDGEIELEAVFADSMTHFLYDDELSRLLIVGASIAKMQSRFLQMCHDEVHVGVTSRFDVTGTKLLNALFLLLGVKTSTGENPFRVKHHLFAALWRIFWQWHRKFDKGFSHEYQLMICRSFSKCISGFSHLSYTKLESTDRTTCSVTLQATLCFFFPYCPAICIDAVAEAWGIAKIVKGLNALSHFTKSRGDVIHHLQSNFQQKVGEDSVQFLIILTHFLYVFTTLAAVTVEDLVKMTSWAHGLFDEFGGFVPYLKVCELLQIKGDQRGSKSILSRQKKKQPLNTNSTNLEDYSAFVRPKAMGEKANAKRARQTNIEGKLPFSELPLAGAVKKANLTLEKMAVEEILNIMPRQKIPMFIGEIGTHIGIWSKFNAKYNGVLGYNLKAFLENYPEHFSVVDHIVMRTKESNLQQFSIVKESNAGQDGGYGSDHSNDRTRSKHQKRQLQQLLTGGAENSLTPVQRRKAAKSGKVRRKLVKKVGNLKRFDKNRKKVDPSAKVPGYVKAKHKRVQGRGRKMNMRNFKR